MTRKTGMLGLLAAVLPLLSGGPAGAAPAAPSVRVVEVLSDAIDGELEGLTATELTVETATGSRTVPLGRVQRMDVRGTQAPSLSGTAHLRVRLVGGEILLGTFAGGIEDGLVLATPDLGRVPLLLDVVRTIVPVAARAGLCDEPEERHRPERDDVAYLRSKDQFSGIVLEVGTDGVVLETERGRKRRVAWPDLEMLRLQNDAPKAAEGTVVELETVEGARLVTAAPPTWEDGALHFALRSVPERALEISPSRVRTLRTSGGAFTYASDLPFESEFKDLYEDASQERWCATRTDRRRLGCPLRLHGVTYRHGFAMHSWSRVTIPLGKRWRLFHTLFGVDDVALEGPEAFDAGIVDARLLLDGKVVWEAPVVKAGEVPREIGPLDVSDVDTLVLEVGFGPEKQQVRDRATWADPILLRK